MFKNIITILFIIFSIVDIYAQSPKNQNIQLSKSMQYNSIANEKFGCINIRLLKTAKKN